MRYRRRWLQPELAARIGCQDWPMPHTFCNSNKTGAGSGAPPPLSASKLPSRKTENGRKTCGSDPSCNSIDADFKSALFALQKVCGISQSWVCPSGAEYQWGKDPLE